MPPFHLQYALDRRQRLLPHLVIWTPYLSGFLAAFVAVLYASFNWSPRLLFGLLPILWMTKGFFIGLANIVREPRQEIDILIENGALGYLAGGKRSWVPLDGVEKVEKICPDVWTLAHHNGTVVNIPAGTVTDAQIGYLRPKAGG
jgi:hypothetical protein